MTINEDEFKELKILYNKAVEEKKSEFLFMEQKLLVNYTKYLIEYLENEMKKHNKYYKKAWQTIAYLGTIILDFVPNTYEFRGLKPAWFLLEPLSSY